MGSFLPLGPTHHWAPAGELLLFASTSWSMGLRTTPLLPACALFLRFSSTLNKNTNRFKFQHLRPTGLTGFSDFFLIDNREISDNLYWLIIHLLRI